MRHPSARRHVADIAATGTLKGDPTGTADMIRAYKARVVVRWNRARAVLKTAVIDQDALGLGPVRTSPLGLAMQGVPDDQKVRGWQLIVDKTLEAVVLEHDSTYLDPMISVAYGRALKRAQKLTGTDHVPPTMANDVAALQQLAMTELQGINEAVSQGLVRLAGFAIVNGDDRKTLWLQMADRIDKIGITRSNALVSALIVKAFTVGTLKQFAAAGVSNVGVLPELVPVIKKRIGDARAKGPGSRSSRTEAPSRSTIGRIRRATKQVESLGTVEVLTAGDDLVCYICQGIADDGPYKVSTALSLIPAHPECRCAFVPAEDARFAGDE
jgi:hypothetical protein